MNATHTPTRALIIVDVQNDFVEGGALGVDGGGLVAERIAKHLDGITGYDLIVASLDYHKPLPDTNCGHFAVDTAPDFVKSWPVHCVAGTAGALLHPALDDHEKIDRLVLKGHGTQSYSAFEGVTTAEYGSHSLLALLRSNDVTELDVVGIATDYCVRATALDALGLGFRVRVLRDMIAGVAEESSERALEEMIKAGAEIL